MSDDVICDDSDELSDQSEEEVCVVTKQQRGESELLGRLREVETQIKNLDRSIRELETKRKNLISLKNSIKSNILKCKANDLAKKDWSGEDHVWSGQLKECLQKKFGISGLRTHQLPTMNATLSGTDCILVMPTGGGKSLCYQLPALISKGITLVVSPLISLMEDQIMGLKRLGIEARKLSAGASKEEVNFVHTAMTDPKAPLKLLYVTPEKLSKSKRFMSKLQKMHQMGRFSRLAIDEVHCCSQWGHDFRPDYKYLGIMRQMFPGTPILGLTATATSRVIEDVQKILNIQGCLVLRAPFNRPNLFYEVRAKPSSQKECVEQLAHLLRATFRDQSGIIYTMTIKETEQLATDLGKEGIKVAPYHAELLPEYRTKIHRKWLSNEYQAVIATIAFGMGIDKPDVRYVIHHCISKSMENFYQESGRAGRDDKPAKCILFWRFADMARQSTMVFTEQTGLDNFYGMIAYCLDSHRCRRSIIAEHFDERWHTTDCDRMCDHCCKAFSVNKKSLVQEGKALIRLLNHASSLDVRLTGPKLVDVWMGKGTPNLRIKECTTKMSKERAENMVAFLLIDGYLREDFHYTPYSTISYIVPGYKCESGLEPSPIDVASTERARIVGEDGEAKKSSSPDRKQRSLGSKRAEGTDVKMSKRPRVDNSEGKMGKKSNSTTPSSKGGDQYVSDCDGVLSGQSSGSCKILGDVDGDATRSGNGCSTGHGGRTKSTSDISTGSKERIEKSSNFPPARESDRNVLSATDEGRQKGEKEKSRKRVFTLDSSDSD